MFLHPSQVAGVMSGVAGVTSYRFVIGREDHVDTLRCEVVPATPGDSTPLVDEVTARIRDGLRFRAEVVVVDELPPGEGPLLDTRDWD